MKPQFKLRPRSGGSGGGGGGSGKGLTVVTMFGETPGSTAKAMATNLPSPKHAPPVPHAAADASTTANANPALKRSWDQDQEEVWARRYDQPAASPRELDEEAIRPLFEGVEEDGLDCMHQPSLVSPRDLHEFVYPQEESDEDFDDEGAVPPPPPPLMMDDFDDDEFDFAAFGNQLQPAKLPPPPPPRRARSLAQKKDFDQCFYVAEGRSREFNCPVLVFDCQHARSVLFKYNLESEVEDLLLEFSCKLLARVADQGKYALVVLAAFDFTELVKHRDMFVRLIGAVSPMQRVRKQVQQVWIVRPVALTQSLLFTARLVLSRKLWRKLYFFTSLDQVNQLLLVPLTCSNTAVSCAMETDGEEQLPRNFYHHWQCALSLGTSLRHLCHKSPFGIPSFLHRCVTYLLYHGLATNGLFRIGEDQDLLTHCKQQLESGRDVDLGGYWSSTGKPANTESVHVCAHLLKQFVRQLPEPLFPPAAYERVVQLASESNGDRELLTYVLAKTLPKILPKAHFATLRYLMGFLYYCAKHDSGTLMNAQNLAKIWNINLFRFDSNPQVELANLPQTITVTLVMVEDFWSVFPPAPDAVLPVCFSPVTGAELVHLEWDGNESEVDLVATPTPTAASAAAAAAAQWEAAPTPPVAVDELEQQSNKDLKRLLVKFGVTAMPLERAECLAMAKSFLTKQPAPAPEAPACSSRTVKPTSKSSRLHLLNQISHTDSMSVEAFLSTENEMELAGNSSVWNGVGIGGRRESEHVEDFVLPHDLPLFGEKSARSLVLPKTSPSLRELDKLSAQELAGISGSHTGAGDLKPQARSKLIHALLAGGSSAPYLFKM